MVSLRGKGSMTDINLIAKTYDNAVTKDGKSQYFDIQVDHRDPQGKDQRNLHLTSQKEQNGEINNGKAYHTSQVDQFKEAAGPNAEPVLNKAGDKQLGSYYAFKASLTSTKDNRGLVVNTNKPLGQSDFKLDEKAVDGQYTSMSEASAQQAAEKAAQAEQAAPEAQSQADASQAAPAEAAEAAADDQPAMG